jgi:oligopeptide/dipeptide ABC transporter ATP-binding protein
MVFQNPDSTLNPSFSVGYQIARPLRRFKTLPRGEVRGEVIRLLNMMKLGENYYNRLPRQLSGGEKQRVAIARAIAAQPKLVLCDEPVSALDVSVQAAVLNLLLEIQQELGTTLVFIAHDLSVVRFFCDHLAVMYLGQIAEIGPAEAIYLPPYHPYTEALLSAVPIPDPRAEQKHIRLSGTVPSALNPPSGCRFHTPPAPRLVRTAVKSAKSRTHERWIPMNTAFTAIFAEDPRKWSGGQNQKGLMLVKITIKHPRYELMSMIEAQPHDRNNVSHPPVVKDGEVSWSRANRCC